jgi:hypothetical protein
MKQGIGMRAYRALGKLMAQDISLQTAKKVFDMHNKLQKIWDFQLNEEKKILNRYPNVDPMTGSVTYSEGDEEMKKSRLEELDGFNRELDALSEIEHDDIEIEPITIHMDEEPGLKLSGNDLKALVGFVTFE